MLKRDDVLAALRASSDEAEYVLNKLQKSASRVSTLNTSTISGMLGGVIGLTAAYGLTFVAPVSLHLVGGLLTTLGILCGVLFYRGPQRTNMESRLEENRIKSDEVMRRIKALPKNTREDVRDCLWDAYKTLNSPDNFAAQLALPRADTSNDSLPSLSRRRNVV